MHYDWAGKAGLFCYGCSYKKIKNIKNIKIFIEKSKDMYLRKSMLLDGGCL